MKKIICVFLLLCAATYVKAQNYVIESSFRPFTFEEMKYAAMAQAAKREKFDEYKDVAYNALKKGDKYTFITYTNYALSTGYYNAKMYYDRGKVFQELGNYKQAKKEYKKAKKKGYYQADVALQNLKNIQMKRK